MGVDIEALNEPVSVIVTGPFSIEGHDFIPGEEFLVESVKETEIGEYHIELSQESTSIVITSLKLQELFDKQLVARGR